MSVPLGIRILLLLLFLSLLLKLFALIPAILALQEGIIAIYSFFAAIIGLMMIFFLYYGTLKQKTWAWYLFLLWVVTGIIVGAYNLIIYFSAIGIISLLINLIVLVYIFRTKEYFSVNGEIGFSGMSKESRILVVILLILLITQMGIQLAFLNRTCIDNDDGLNFNIKSTASASGVKLFDNCIDNVLKEAYCDGAKADFHEHNCENICLNGVCVE